MRKVLLLAILLASSRVHAERKDLPPEGDEAGHVGREAEHGPKTEAGEVSSEAGEDPTDHFNFTDFGYRNKDEFGGPLGDSIEVDRQGRKREEEPMSAPFVLLLANFGVLLIILGKYGAPAARKLAEERHDLIKNALDDAAALRSQAAAKLAEYETRIKDVDAEVKKLMEGIRSDAEADKQRILEAAKLQAEHTKRDAEQRIAAEIELARAQLTKEISIAATTATEKLLRDKTTPDDQNKLVSQFIAGVSGSGQPGARS